MALLYVTEYTHAGRYYGAAIPIADTGTWVENASSPMAIGAAIASAPFGATTNLIRVNCDAVCSIIITTAGTLATTSNARLAANQTEYWAVHPGQILSVIANT